MRVLDLFAGLEGWSAPFRERGHDVISVDIDPRFGCTITQDIMEPLDLAPGGDSTPWSPDIILASPPCEKFSLMALGHHWLPGYVPKHDGTHQAMALVARTVNLIRNHHPAFWIVENPMGMLRKLDLIPWERSLVTYCSYGLRYRKATDLWGGFPPSLRLNAPCHNGDPCHVAAPRGSRTGVQGPETAAERAKVPYDLALDVCISAERDLAMGRVAADYSGRLFA